MDTISAFKIVRCDANGVLSSLFVQCSAKVCYKEGEFVPHPKDCGPLAVLATPEAVLRFVEQYSSLPEFGEDRFVIYVCEVVLSKDKELWRIFPGGTKVASVRSLPPGTLLADSVKLTKKISLNDCRQLAVNLAQKERP